ncbi:hypothetical protein FF36_04331 [Frankia torreyi]|uniref:Uncharacterized protein n=1 Tax=Frankia torreyi TaxID=1856 RepID=A0A0D8BBD4_9ACTN|nr:MULTISPECIES: hypothetical protein [Frankia]KJE21400.1 hypothetical protein FF36_04331 [Frankia torreyi]KQM03425.1 hypothetical protein FF86_10408 [Frankia sp. CpI1-P]
MHVFERLIETPDLVVVLHGVQAQPAGFMAGLMAGFFAVGPNIVRFLSVEEEAAARAGREPVPPEAPIWSACGPGAVPVCCELRPPDPACALSLSHFGGGYTTDRRRSHAWVWVRPMPRSGDVACTGRTAGRTGQTVIDGAALRAAARTARRIRAAGPPEGEGRP